MGLSLRALRGMGTLALFCLCLMLYLGKANDVLLRGIDTNIHAAVALQATSQGFVPKVPTPLLPDAAGEDAARQERFNDHPFFSFWVNGWIMRLLGANAFSARLTTALAAAGGVLLTLGVGIELGGIGLGIVAALFLGVARDWVFTGATMSLDPLMIFFILLSFWLALKRRWIATGLAAGFGLWIKTPIVLMVFPAFALHHLVQYVLAGKKRRWDWTFSRKGLVALSISVALGLVFWGLVGWIGGGEVVRDYWHRQLWGTAVGGRGGVDYQPWLFLTTLRLGFLPGLPFLLFAIFWLTQKKRWRSHAFSLCASAVVCVALPVTLMRFKMGHYFTPTFPFLALIAALPVAPWAAKVERFVWPSIVGLTLALLTFAVVTPFPFAPESFLALKRFMPFIQTYGDCSDRVALIGGGEPIGSSHDYELVLHTYVQKPVVSLSCEALAAHLTSTPRTKWVILAASDLGRCVPAPMLAQFGLRFRAGGQVLLGRVAGSAAAAGGVAGLVDLTPLQRELQIAVDCKAPPYVKDIFHSY